MGKPIPQSLFDAADFLQQDEEIPAHIIVAKAQQMSSIVQEHSSLLAAAPELLKALRKIHTGVQHAEDGQWLEIRKLCERAIAKAEGK